MISGTETVRTLAARIPGATRVFERYRIDYCCGGDRKLADACSGEGVALGDLIGELEQAARAGAAVSGENWNASSPSELVEHLIDKHHTYTREELSRLKPLAQKVFRVHGARHPELEDVLRSVEELEADLVPHLAKEERVLFPYIKALDASHGANITLPRAPFGTVRSPIRMMHVEHERVGILLKQLRKLTADYSRPSDTCGSYEALYAGLEALEKDLFEHIHLENNVLFPRALELEDRVVDGLHKTGA